MTTYICIPREGGDPETYVVDTNDQREIARAALREVGMHEAHIYVGEPDGLGDSHKNGAVLLSEADPIGRAIAHQRRDLEQARADLRKAKEDGAPTAEIRRLEKLVERLSNFGD